MEQNNEPADETPAVQTSTEATAPLAATRTQPAIPDTPNAAVPDAETTEVAQVCAQAARIGISIDTADAAKRGLKPDALPVQVLENLAETNDAAAIIATAPAAAAAKDSPLVAAAKTTVAEAGS